MEFTIEIKDSCCTECGKKLSDERVIAQNSISQQFCKSCAKQAELNDIYYYYNMDDGTAKPLLDQSNINTLSKVWNGGRCKNVTEYDGAIDELSIPDNAIVLIELYDRIRRAYPQKYLIDEDEEIQRFIITQNRLSADKVTVKKSHSSDRIYIFYKTDSPEDTYDRFSKIKQTLTFIERSRPVFMERCETDPHGLAKLMLSELGHKCVYCTKKNIRSETDDRLFNIPFTIKQFFDYCKSRIIGQDKELIKAVFTVYDYIQNISARNTGCSVNWLLTAPSGMGKTEFFRAVRDYFADQNIPIPVLQIDISHVTEAGYRGEDAKGILNQIYNASAANKRHTLPSGTAICFLDEADKKFSPSIDSKGRDFNASAQANLLTLIEGSVMQVPEESATIDTSNTMFVFMGAFQQIRDTKKKTAEILNDMYTEDSELEEAEDSFYDDILLDDMLSEGMLEELAGRISMYINFHKLSKKDMRGLIRSKAEQIGRERGVSVRITSDGLEDLMSIAYTNLGVRAPLNRITELILNTLAESSLKKAFSARNDIIVITGKDTAEIEKKKKLIVHKPAI